MGAAALALAALEVAVGGRGAALARLEPVGVHGQAHGAARLAPLETGRDEYPVEPFGLGLLLDQARAGHNHGTNAVGQLAALHHPGDSAQVLDAGVGAGADEDLVDLDVCKRRAGFEPHIFERTLHGAAPAPVRLLGRVRHHARDRQDLPRVGAPGHLGSDVGGIQRDLLVVGGALVRGQGAPVGHRLLPLAALGRHGPALDIREGGLIRRDQPGPGAGLDRHVAHRHTAGHGKIADRLARVLDDVAGATGDPDLADHGQDHVLGGDPKGRIALDRNAHVLGRPLDQGLGRQHVLDLRGADTEGQRPEGAMGRGVAVAADDGHAGLGHALFRADDVNDALADVRHGEVRDAELGAVPLQGLDLNARFRVVDAARTVGGRHVVVADRQGGLGPPHPAPGRLEPLEGLGAGHFVDQMAVDIEERGAVVLDVDQMAVPDLVEQGPRHAHVPR